MKIGLGTAQFGMDYGITNALGRLPPESAGEILGHAADSGIDLIDTAAAYGESEGVLGAVLWPGHPFRIVSKVPPLRQPGGSPKRAGDRLRESVAASLRRLRQDRLYAMLLHRADDLLQADGPEVLASLVAVKNEGLVERIGISVYRAEELDAVLSIFTPDIVQLPINILDQRLIRSGHIRKLADASVEIHARSILLQGVLLADPQLLPDHFAPYVPLLRRFRESALDRGLVPLEMAVGFVCSVPEVHCAIVGVTTTAELDEIVRASHRGGRLEMDWSSYRCDDESLVNPSLWPHRPSQRGARAAV